MNYPNEVGVVRRNGRGLTEVILARASGEGHVHAAATLAWASQISLQRVLLTMNIAFFVVASPWVARAAERTASPAVIEPRLQICPLDLFEVRSITPLGNLNPRGGHVFPTDHIYLDYGHREGLPVRAPASGRVFAIRSQIGDDFKIEVQVNDRLSYYVAHVLPVKGLSAASSSLTPPVTACWTLAVWIAK
jgi:hypothetical protein